MLFSGNGINPIFAAAAMSGGMTAFLFWIFGAGLLGFVTPLTAQYTGANAPDKAKKVLAQALMLSGILSIPLLLFGRSLAFYYFTFLRLPVWSESHKSIRKYSSAYSVQIVQTTVKVLPMG